MWRALSLSLVVVLVLGCGTAAFGQAVNGTIRGTIRDSTGAILPGVTVTTDTAAAAGVRTVVSDRGGVYRLQNLPPGEYTVLAELPGFAKFTHSGIVVRADVNIQIDIEMKVGGATETVKITAEAPMLEVAKTVQAVNISGDFLRSIPLTTKRSFDNFLFMTPGVVSQDLGSSGYFFLVHGAAFNAHVIQLDGADVGSSQVGYTIGINMGNEMIEDVQVKTGAMDAASPMAEGAVMNMVSKSGTNQFKGSFNQVFQRKQWSGNNQPGGTTSAFSYVESAIAEGGPIKRDKVWFFGTYKYASQTSGISRTPTQLKNLQGLIPGWQPFDTKLKTDFVFVKPTVHLSPNHQLSGFYEFDHNLSDFSGSQQDKPFGNLGSKATTLNARLSSTWGNNFTTRLTALYNNRGSSSGDFPEQTPQRQIYTTISLSGGVWAGSGPIATLAGNASVSDSHFSKSTIAFDATYFKRGLVGSHEAQAGFYLQPRLHQQLGSKNANGGLNIQQEVLRDPTNPAGGTIPFDQFVQPEYTVSQNLDSHDYAFYLQDAWRPVSRLTITPGVRIDVLRRYDNLFKVSAQHTTEVAPKIGAVYVLTKDAKNIVRGTWGRTFENPSVGFNASPGFFSFDRTVNYDLDLNGTFETAIVTPGLTTLTLNRIIDPKLLHQPHVDEWLGGYSRQLPGRISLDVSVMRREFRGNVDGLDVNAIFEGGVFKGYANPDFNSIIKVLNNEWNWVVYRMFEATVTRQTSNVQMLASYTRQFYDMAGTYQPADPAGIISPGSFPNSGGAVSAGSAAQPNSLSGGDSTGCRQCIPHLFRVAASFRAPFGIQVAGSLNVQAGQYSGPIVQRIGAADPAFGPPTLVVVNSSGVARTVSNPLATTLRFAYPTRGEGQLQLKRRGNFSFRLGRAFTFGPRRLEVSADVLNVLNSDADQSFLGGANQQFSANFGKAGLRVTPRQGQFGLRFIF